jgi:hypothetical protein
MKNETMKLTGPIRCGFFYAGYLSFSAVVRLCDLATNTIEGAASEAFVYLNGLSLSFPDVFWATCSVEPLRLVTSLADLPRPWFLEYGWMATEGIAGSIKRSGEIRKRSLMKCIAI